MNDYMIVETEHFTVNQADYRLPGYVIITSKLEYTQLADFDSGQAAGLLQCMITAERVVQKLVNPERIYIMKFGEVNPRVHFHILPRTRRLADAYVAATHAEEPFNGARVVDWIWDNHASLGFTDDDMQGFVDEARDAWQEG